MTSISKTQKFLPYRITILQELTDDDPDRRLQFCEQIMDLLGRYVVNIENIPFPDELIFSLNSETNRQNSRYRTTHTIRGKATLNDQEIISVRTGIVGDRLIGPLLFQETLNGTEYL